MENDGKFILALYCLYLMDINDFDRYISKHNPNNIRKAIIDNNIDIIVEKIKMADIENLFDDNDKIDDILEKIHIEKHIDIEPFTREFNDYNNTLLDYPIGVDDVKSFIDEYVSHSKDLDHHTEEDQNIKGLITKELIKEIDEHGNHLIFTFLMRPLLKDKKFDEYNKLFEFYPYYPDTISLNYTDDTESRRLGSEIYSILYDNKYLVKTLLSKEFYDEALGFFNSDSILAFVRRNTISNISDMLDNMDYSENSFNEKVIGKNLSLVKKHKYFLKYNIDKLPNISDYNNNIITVSCIINKVKRKFSINFDYVGNEVRIISMFRTGLYDIMKLNSNALKEYYDMHGKVKYIEDTDKVKYYVKHLYEICYELRDCIPNDVYPKFKQYLIALKRIEKMLIDFQP